MPITFVKLIDLYVGTVLLAALNLLALLRPPARALAGNPRRILLIKFWGLGSILLLQPVMRALRRSQPDAEITLLTLSRNRGLLPMLEAVDRMLTLDLERAIALPLVLARLVLDVRRGRYDLVVDCEFYAKLAAILTSLSGAPVRVGFSRKEPLRQRLYTHGVPFRREGHVTRAFAELLAPLGIPVDPEDHALAPPSPEAVGEVEELLQGIGLARDGAAPPFVAVNVNASELAYERRWEAERFARLARDVAGRLGYHVLLVGAPSERPYVEEVRRMAGAPERVHNVSGRTSLPGLQALLLRALLFVSNDSGPLHLAAASGVPCVALFGPETPDLYGPVGAGHRVLYRRLHCSPCMSVHDMKQVVCKGKIDCLKEIAVEEVLCSVRELLVKRSPAVVQAQA